MIVVNRELKEEVLGCGEPENGTLKHDLAKLLVPQMMNKIKQAVQTRHKI